MTSDLLKGAAALAVGFYSIFLGMAVLMALVFAPLLALSAFGLIYNEEFASAVFLLFGVFGSIAGGWYMIRFAIPVYFGLVRIHGIFLDRCNKDTADEVRSMLQQQALTLHGDLRRVVWWRRNA